MEPTTFDKMKMGAMMGGTVGLCVGLVFGTINILRYAFIIARRRLLLGGRNWHCILQTQIRQRPARCNLNARLLHGWLSGIVWFFHVYVVFSPFSVLSMSPMHPKVLTMGYSDTVKQNSYRLSHSIRRSTRTAHHLAFTNSTRLSSQRIYHI